MTHARAISLALQCMNAECKRLAVNANLHDVYHAESPACVAASKRRADLRAAIEALSQPEQERMKL